MQRLSVVLFVGSLSACAVNAPPTQKAVAPVAATTAPGIACAEPERREMDFWIGDWDLVVEAPTDITAKSWTRARGVSAIRSVLKGCAIEENFHADGPDAPWAGRSFSMYVPSKRAWRQTWVDDSGSYLAFDGGRTGDSFTLVGEEKIAGGTTTRMRMVFREISHDSIVWSWERGTVPETTWSPAMVIRYTRRQAPAPTRACEPSAAFHELELRPTLTPLRDGRVDAHRRDFLEPVVVVVRTAPMSVHIRVQQSDDVDDEDMAPTRRSPFREALEDAPTVTCLPSDDLYEEMPETKRR